MSSGAAQAAILDLTYNGNNDFTFQGQNYTSPTALDAFITNQVNQ